MLFFWGVYERVVKSTFRKRSRMISLGGQQIFFANKDSRGHANLYNEEM